MAISKKAQIPYIIQEPSILRCPHARIAKETPYFSPRLETIELLDGVPAGTICIAECSRRGFEAGYPVRAIILLDPLAWHFKPGETQHAFDRDHVACGRVKKSPR
jgi:hypothetical protein